MKAILMLLMMCTAVVAQSRDDLKKRYGAPVAETFLVRAGIIVTASYNSNGQIDELLIAPQITGLIKSRSKILSYDTLKDVLNELAPISERGKPGISSFLNLACLPQNDCSGSSESYEKLTIYYN